LAEWLEREDKPKEADIMNLAQIEQRIEEIKQAMYSSRDILTSADLKKEHDFLIMSASLKRLLEYGLF
jgi:hypothetical protein